MTENTTLQEEKEEQIHYCPNCEEANRTMVPEKARGRGMICGICESEPARRVTGAVEIVRELENALHDAGYSGQAVNVTPHWMVNEDVDEWGLTIEVSVWESDGE